MLDEYVVKLGLGKMINQEVQAYLNLNKEQLAKMTADECMEAAFLLQREALYVQDEINRNEAQITWSTVRIRKSIAADLHNYGTKFTTSEDRAILATKANSYTADLDAKANEARIKIARLNYIPTHLKSIAATLIDYSHVKRGRNYETTRSS